MKTLEGRWGKWGQATKLALSAFLIICIVLSVLCFRYYEQLQNTVQEESSGYLQEISKLLGDNVSRTIHDNFSVLGTIATVLKSIDVNTYAQFLPIAQEQQKEWGFEKLYLVDASGVAYDAFGNSTAFGGETFLQEALVNHNVAMSSSIVVDGMDCIVFAIPIEELVVEGIKVYALAASYELSTFDQILSMTAFGGEAYAHVIHRDGSIVICSSSPKAPATGYNILNTLENAVNESQRDFKTVKEDIAQGKSGMVNLIVGETKTYMVYTPLTGQQWSLLTFVPAWVVNARSEYMLNLTLLLCAFITLAFAVFVLYLTISFYRHKRVLEKIAYVDPITGGNTIQRFYEEANHLIGKSSAKTLYAVVYLNIVKFKLLNDQFGKARCDELLRSIRHGIEADLADDECMGRQYVDNFCILIRYENEDLLTKRYVRWRNASIQYVVDAGSFWIPHSSEFGAFIVTNTYILITHMIDRAKLSLTAAPRAFGDKMHYSIYDENMRHILLREKQLEDRMQAALEAREFEVYLQPKYDVATERIGGAEALVRWRSPIEGLIYPNEFIPLFERNGFVVEIDLFVFEEVCRLQQRWAREGRPTLKISVNCSREHLKTPNFLDKWRRISEKYQLPAEALEIELTESTVFENTHSLTNTIHEIHALGFGCSMDDFGSGYSSLNLIRAIPVDTLKLDKVFFKEDSMDAFRTESVVGSIISMAKSLQMKTVAEGVEERAQVDMLKRLHCDYIQGFYFAKPMPVLQFEQLLAEEDLNSASQE